MFGLLDPVKSWTHQWFLQHLWTWRLISPDPCVRWMVGGCEEQLGRQGGGQQGQGRQGPPFAIHWSGREAAGSFEAMKWSEFQHGHGDCSRPLGRHFDEAVLKMERMFCARRFKGRVLFCWFWNYTQAGKRAAAINLNLQRVQAPNLTLYTY